MFCVPVGFLLRDAGHEYGVVVAMSFTPPFLLVLLLLRVTNSVGLAGHLMVLLVFAALAADFGPDSGFSLVSMLLLPLLGAHLVGPRTGAAWTLFTLALVIVYGPALLAGESVRSDQLIISVAIIAVAVGSAAITAEVLLRARISDSERSEGRLRGFQETVRRFVEHGFPGFLMLHGDLVGYVDPRLSALTGWEDDHWPGSRFLDSVHPDDARELAHQFQVSVESGFRAEVRLRHVEGHWLWVELYAVADPESADGEAVALRLNADTTIDGRRWYVVLRDMSVDMQARAALSRADQLRGSALLAAGLAHDFNNLLTVIRGFGDLMIPGPEREAVLTATNEAVRLTTRLRQISGGGPDRQAFELFDVSKAIREFEGVMRQALGDDVELVVLGFERPLWVRGNVVELRQLLLNVTRNAGEALQHKRSGERSFAIELAFRDVSSADLGLTELAPGDYMMIKLRDTGPGMATEQLERAFEPFFTTKPAPMQAPKPQAGTEAQGGEYSAAGRGLGLAGAHGIARAHGGTLNIASIEGRGTTLTLMLPMADPAQDDVPHGLPSSSRPAMVLLCEDEDDVRRFITKVLQRAGHEVLAAPDTFTAERLVAGAKKAPELLVTDMMLPADRGSSLARRLRRTLPELPVLYISGYAFELMSAEELEKERSAFLAKPLRHGELLSSVEALLSS